MQNILIIEDTLKHQAAARAQFPEAVVVNYDEAYELLRDARHGDYSAILTDLHFKTERNRIIPAMPFGPQFERNDGAIGKEFPFGLCFALKGVELGIPVVIVSDADHHSDMVTAMLDMMGFLVQPRGGKDEKRHFIKGGGRGPESFSWENRVQNPRLISKMSNCPKAEDMHWNGDEIVSAPPVKPEPYTEQGWKTYANSQVKDWREAHRLLSAVMAES
ncbi:MAG: hypothetical protein ABL917_00120 [Parcubacteria group bacterium]